MADIAAVAATIAAAPAPVICFDTCSLLDIIRDPVKRTEQTAARARQVLCLLNEAEATPTKLHVVLAHQATVELGTHRVPKATEAIKALEGIDHLIARICAVTAELGGVAPVFPLLATSDFGSISQGVLNRFVNCAHVLDEDQDIVNRAIIRARNNQPPGGKANVKDPLVIETYFKLMQTLRSGGFGPPAAFISSNTHDYCGNGANLDVRLEPEFRAIGLEYVPTFGAAYGSLLVAPRPVAYAAGATPPVTAAVAAPIAAIAAPAVPPGAAASPFLPGQMAGSSPIGWGAKIVRRLKRIVTGKG
jgi:hypothetical protein